MSRNYQSTESWCHSFTNNFLPLAPQLSPFKICAKAGACFLEKRVQQRLIPNFSSLTLCDLLPRYPCQKSVRVHQELLNTRNDLPSYFRNFLFVFSCLKHVVLNMRYLFDECYDSKMIKLCPSRNPGIASVLEKDEHASDGVDNAVTCVFCKMVVIRAQNQLRKNNTDAQIKT